LKEYLNYFNPIFLQYFQKINGNKILNIFFNIFIKNMLLEIPISFQ